MRRSLLACGVLLALAAGCASNTEESALGKKLRCPECDLEWFHSTINRTDNGYGSAHFIDTKQNIGDQCLAGKLSVGEARARIQKMEEARTEFWQDCPQVQKKNDAWATR